MRTIQVDPAVFAAIWREWEEGDSGENAILRRVFHLPPAEAVPEAGPESPKAREDGGHTDKRSGTHFPEGFEIFRTFKGVPYRATASNGEWRLADGRTAPSLNALSVLVGATTENAWTGWYYKDNGGQKLVNEMRAKRTAT